MKLLNGDAGPTVAEMAFDRIRELETLVRDLAETLELAENGLRWYASLGLQGDGSDWEMLSQIKTVLARVPQEKL